MKKLKIYCDAGSYNNGYKKPNEPMYGSYGSLIVQDNKILYKFSDYYEDITNNQGELYGFIKAYYEFLRRYKSGEKYSIEVISDSQYLINGVNQYLPKWKKNNWQNSSKQPVKNKLMWMIIDGLINIEDNIELIFKWQKGHIGKKVTLEENPDVYFNEICDSLATEKINYCISEENSMICPVNEFTNIINKLAKQLKITNEE